jgi:hypothetical protein
VKGVDDSEILETYFNSASKNTSETDIFAHGTKSLLTSVIYSVNGHTLTRTGTYCAVAGTESRQPRIVEARVLSQASPCGVCGEQSGTRTGFSPNTSFFPGRYHSTNTDAI